MTNTQSSPIILYHCTTDKKLQRYQTTGGILSPVRGWIFENSAREWCRKTGRNIILKIEVETVYPLPDHKPIGHSYWSPDFVRKWELSELVTHAKKR